ncbi:MAG: SpaH/EbpB family LPXTG-anchored major pilin, partial [Ruminococcus sp.]|nr:SpaH/EbpB family LPXTG-anchored major pilin [Ruminococcus sp.]
MKLKKILSILLAVIISMAAFVIPISAGAVTTKKVAVTPAWEDGSLDTENGKEITGYHCFRTEFIDISDYSEASFARLNAPDGKVYGGYGAYWYDENKNYITSTRISNNGRYYSNQTRPVEGTYMRVEYYTDYSLSELNDINNLLSITLNYTPQPLIDTTQVGSLRIYKYEMDDVSLATTPGTGYETDKSNLPESAKPLAGVTFTIKKVAEVSSPYFTADGKALPTAAEAKSMTAIGSPISKTTDSTGLALFTNLPLGIYLVQETSSPSQVTAKVSDFVVSIPTTSIDGDGWKYNVTVNPKNQTKYQEISALKVDYLTGEP